MMLAFRTCQITLTLQGVPPQTFLELNHLLMKVDNQWGLLFHKPKLEQEIAPLWTEEYQTEQQIIEIELYV